MRKKIILIAIILLAIIITLNWHSKQPAQPANSNSPATTKAAAGFNKSQYSLTDPTSIWVVVNKQRPLNPQNYVPPDLVVPNVPLRVPGNDSMQVRSVIAGPMEQLFAAASAQQAPLMLSSGYRSYTYQTGLYNDYVAASGQASADTFSARPGYSEHQTGLAFDVEPLNQQCDVDQCFANLPAGKWIVANAYKYGFIIRYPADKVPITGFMYEPWHLRYVGKPLAAEMHKDHIETLEEFFGLPAAPNYAH